MSQNADRRHTVALGAVHSAHFQGDLHRDDPARSANGLTLDTGSTSPITGAPASPQAAGRLTPLAMVPTGNRDRGKTTGNLSDFRANLPAGAIRPQLHANRVGAILKNFKFFQDMEDSVRQKLPAIAIHVRYPEGTILFRQGDPPGNCYAILSGEVGIFVRSEEEDIIDSARIHSPSLARTAARFQTLLYNSTATPTNSGGTASATPSSPSAGQAAANPAANRGSLMVGSHAREPMFAMPKRRALSLSSLELSEDLATMFALRKTAEGFSNYHDGSEIGQRCAVFGPGKLFGELALMQSVPRSATIKCLKDSEFLVICRREFDQVLKEEIAQANSRKNKFLHDHVPGMRDLPPVKLGCNRPHASYFFKKASYCKDHEFLTQGMCQEDTLFVIIRGSVELRRYETPGRKLPSRRNRRVMKSWTPSQQVTQDSEDEVPEKEDYVRKMGIMLAGSVFGSLPMAEPEPFTVVANSLCEAYYVSGQDFMKLPRSLINSIQEHLANTVTWRLARLKSDRCITLKESPVNLEDASNLSMSAKNYGLKLMQVGKIHPHPVLLKSSAVQPKDLIKKRTASTGLSSSESLPSMSQQTSAQLSQFSQTASMMSRGSLKGSGLMQRPATVNGPVRAWDR